MNRRTFIVTGAATLLVAGCATHETETEMLAPTGEIAPGTNRDFNFTVPTSNPDRVWDLWTQPDTWKDWDKGLKSASLEGEMELSSVGKIVPLSGPTSTFEVVAFDPKQRYAFETRLPGSVLRVERYFNAARTKFTHHVTFSGLTAGLFARTFGPGFRQALPPTMRQIKALSERN